MGILASCCGRGEPEQLLTPDQETRRRQQAEAAERRLRESETRGIKDPEKVKRMMKKSRELEGLEKEAGRNEAPLRWQMN